MAFVFTCIGLSFFASLLCLLFESIIPGILSMTTSLTAIIAFALIRKRERTKDSVVVKVDGVAVDSRGDAKSTVDAIVSDELENEKKRTSSLQVERDIANREAANLTHSAAGIKNTIEELAASFGNTNLKVAIRTALSNLEKTMGLAAGIREKIAGQTAELSATCDVLKKRRTGERYIDTPAGGENDKALLVMASTLEELCEQSNVIAVNGAIEAARIGKQGKGFSVIAREMQKFAGQAKVLADEFRAFRVSQVERRNGEGDKEAALNEWERVLREAIERASTVSVNLSEDVNRLIATGATGDLDELSKIVETEIESRQKATEQLNGLLRDTE